MTGLSRPGGGRQAPGPLVSTAGILDGRWHRIGVVWDGAARALYVDDALVGEDIQGAVTSATGELTLGCGSSRAPGTFFAGLLDDVRVYNQAVRP